VETRISWASLSPFWQMLGSIPQCRTPMRHHKRCILLQSCGRRLSVLTWTREEVKVPGKEVRRRKGVAPTPTSPEPTALPLPLSCPSPRLGSARHPWPGSHSGTKLTLSAPQSPECWGGSIPGPCTVQICSLDLALVHCPTRAQLWTARRGYE
jgi:hypothetical protein